MDIKDIFNKIEKIEDIKKYMSDIEDGETSYLEFKGVHDNLLDKSKKKESARFRLTIAKEICAFANTDGGILIIGIDKRKGVDLELNNECENIESWADNNLTDLLEPRLHGFSVKSIEADSGNRPIAIYVPRSKMAPHRVRNSYPKVLKGEKETKIQQKAISFFEKNYPYILREKALNFIQNIDRNNSECYLVTASLDIWVKPFSEKLNLKLLSTQAKFEHGIYIGEFATKNCNGIEKVNRIKEVINNQSFDKTIAFGDTSGDKEMLTWADESHYKFFH